MSQAHDAGGAPPTSFVDICKRLPRLVFSMVGSLALLLVLVEAELLFLKLMPTLEPPPPEIRNILPMAIESPQNNWIHLARIILVVLLSAHLYSKLHCTRYFEIDGKRAVQFLGAGLILWALYYIATANLVVRYEGHQLSAVGHRFVIGGWYTDEARSYREKNANPPFTQMIDDHAEAIDALWSPASVSAAYALLGLLYMATLILLALAIAAAAECCLEVMQRLLDGSHNSRAHGAENGGQLEFHS